MRLAQKVSTAVLNTLIPPRCLGCTQIVETQGSLCPTCWSGLTFIESPLCKKCGFPFEHHIAEDALCAGCMHEEPIYHQCRSLLVYDEHSKKIILPFKHGDGTHMAPYFASWMKRITPKDIDLIVPVPLHWTRLLKRAYNQSSLISQALSEQTSIQSIPDLLVRTKKTSTQGGLTRQKRLDNVKGAFRSQQKYKSLLKEKSILLIDDVFTTGATLIECAKTLQKEGAKRVSLLTLARVVQPQRAT